MTIEVQETVNKKIALPVVYRVGNGLCAFFYDDFEMRYSSVYVDKQTFYVKRQTQNDAENEIRTLNHQNETASISEFEKLFMETKTKLKDVINLSFNQ